MECLVLQDFGVGPWLLWFLLPLGVVLLIVVLSSSADAHNCARKVATSNHEHRPSAFPILHSLELREVVTLGHTRVEQRLVNSKLRCRRRMEPGEGSLWRRRRPLVWGPRTRFPRRLIDESIYGVV